MCSLIRTLDLTHIDALLSPDIALEPLVEEWIENYQEAANDEVSEKAAVYELVLFFIRSAGLNAAIEEDEAMDVDGVGDVVERIQDESVNVSTKFIALEGSS